MWPWTGGARRRTQAAVAQARAEAYLAGQVAGWHDAETHYQPTVAELRQRLADAEVQRRVTAEMCYASGWNEAMRYAVHGPAAWQVPTAAGKAS